MKKQFNEHFAVQHHYAWGGVDLEAAGLIGQLRYYGVKVTNKDEKRKIFFLTFRIFKHCLMKL